MIKEDMITRHASVVHPGALGLHPPALTDQLVAAAVVVAWAVMLTRAQASPGKSPGPRARRGTGARALGPSVQL